MPGDIIDLSIDMDVKDAIASSKELEKNIRSALNDASGKKLSNELKTLLQHLNNNATKAKELRAQIDKLSTQKIPTKEYVEINKQITKAEKDLNKLLETQYELQQASKDSGDHWEKNQEDIEAVGRVLRDARGELEELKRTGQDFVIGAADEKTAEKIDNLKNKLSSLNNDTRQTLDKAGATTNLKKKLEELGKVASSVFKNIINLAGKAVKIVKGFKSVFSTLGNEGKNSIKLFKTMLAAGLGVRGLYMLFRKLVSSIKEGITNLRQFRGGNNEVNASLNMLQNSLTQMKNAWGAAFAPILSMVAPALNTLINLVTAATNAVAQFFAILSGKSTFLKATKQQKDYAKATGGSAKQVEKLRKELAGFDDLDVLNPDNDDNSSSGGGAGALDFNSMWEEMPAVSKLADLIKEAWASDDILTAFEDVGRYIGVGLKNALDNALENFWPNIQDFARKFAQAIAGTINGFVTTPGLAQSIGANIAAAINTALTFLSNFWNGVRWSDVGSFIYEGFLSAIQNIEWDTLWDYLVGKLNGIIDFLIAAIGDGQWIYEMSYHLGEGIRRIITEVDWLSILQLLVMIGGSIIQGLIDGILGRQPEVNEITYSVMEQAVIDNEGNVWAIGTDLGTTLIKAAGDGIVGSRGDFYAIIDDTNTHITGTTDEVIAQVLEKTGYTKEELSTILGGISTDVAIKTDEMHNKVTSTTQLINEDTQTKLEELSQNTGTKYSELSKIYETGSKGNYDTVLNSLKNINVDTLKYLTENVDKVSKSLDLISENVTETTEAIAKTITELLNDGIKEDVKSFIDWMSGDMTTSIQSAFDGVANGFKGTMNKMIDYLQAVANAAAQAMESVARSINAMAIDIPEWVPDLGGKSWHPSLPTSLGRISIPKLAQGAVIPPNKEFLAMLGDQKSGTNIEAPLETIVEAMQQALGSMQIQNNGYSEMTLDGETFARLITPYVVSELNREGYHVKLLEG